MADQAKRLADVAAHWETHPETGNYPLDKTRFAAFDNLMASAAESWRAEEERLMRLAMRVTPVPQSKELAWFHRSRDGISDFRAFTDTGYYIVERAGVDQDGRPLWNFYHVTEHDKKPFEPGTGWLASKPLHHPLDAKMAAQEHYATRREQWVQ